MSNLAVFTSLFVAGEAFLAPRKQVPVAVPQKIGSPIEGAALKAKATSGAADRFKQMNAGIKCPEGLEIETYEDCEAAFKEIRNLRGNRGSLQREHTNPVGCSMNAQHQDIWYFSKNRNKQKVLKERHMICRVGKDSSERRYKPAQGGEGCAADCLEVLVAGLQLTRECFVCLESLTK